MNPEEKVAKERQLLERLVKFGNQFRATPIVDDDFPTLRDEFDAVLCEATEHIKGNNPVRVSRRRVTIDGCNGQDEVIVTTIQ